MNEKPKGCLPLWPITSHETGKWLEAMIEAGVSIIQLYRLEQLALNVIRADVNMRLARIAIEDTGSSTLDPLDSTVKIQAGMDYVGAQASCSALKAQFSKYLERLYKKMGSDKRELVVNVTPSIFLFANVHEQVGKKREG